MDEPREERNEDMIEQKSSGKGWVVGVVVLLGCALLISLGYAWNERNTARNLASQQDQMTADLTQTRSELDALSSKVNALSVPSPPQAAPAEETAPATGTAQAGHTMHRRPRVVEDRRWKKIQNQLTAQQQQLDSTRQDLEQTRSELADNLQSTKDELDGSIAKTHDELVALERKGERNYFEFDLTKSKKFQRVGPFSLSLRKVNTKHGFFDLAMIVNDSRLSKKHVDLYEPVLIYPEDSKQPVGLVVNQLGKNTVHGYLNEPKYAESARGASESSPTSTTGAPADSRPASTEPSTLDAAPQPTNSGTTSDPASSAKGTPDQSQLQEL